MKNEEILEMKKGDLEMVSRHLADLTVCLRDVSARLNNYVGESYRKWVSLVNDMEASLADKRMSSSLPSFVVMFANDRLAFLNEKEAFIEKCFALINKFDVEKETADIEQLTAIDGILTSIGNALGLFYRDDGSFYNDWYKGENQ